jgi:predicted NBD/HSP70 family sugar kinase
MRAEIEGQNIKTEVLVEARGDFSHIDAHCLVRAVRKKDPYALKVWDEFTIRLAQGIGTILMNFNPEVVILGTIAVHSGELLLHPLRQQLTHFAWRENTTACRLEASTLGEEISELSGLALAKLALIKLGNQSK